ncbi:hypothetical protein Poli38472_012142 [Pythium oligandrum]|uniref:GAF domain-containing protein n=1 Tax=Pythium oligandrum TaxID=41045 RepID=A0A8K1CNR6_PYTOL|nr:hypothetical protein Poli38472_012142 [Pythium oligandrum]|eukprot:TMW67026.1 hypothetical protein Poli38472_012142 [Pythium oligandrum]
MASSDHPVFQRLSRLQLVARRRNIGYQTLVFQSSEPRTERCKHCGRQFSTDWKAFLCHVCGLWVCQPCSCVLERERELQYITFIRSCIDCVSMLNKWSDADLFTEFATHPWVVSSSKKQISLTLADTLRIKKESRHAVLTVLKYLGKAVDPDALYLDTIEEDEWIAATTECNVSHPSDVDVNSLETPTERVHHLVQLCFEVEIPEVPLGDCVFAESDGTRHYALRYDDPDEPSDAPCVPDEDERLRTIEEYGSITRSLNTPLMQLICALVAKELDVWSAYITMVKDKTQYLVAAPPGCPCSMALKRSQSFCAYALASPRPFMVRDASMDIRFRNLDVVRGGSHLVFYIAFPIVDENGKTVALLCALDSKPHKSITTMQYSVMQRLAAMTSSFLQKIVDQCEQ